MGAPRMTRADSWRKRPVVLRYFQYKDEIRAFFKDKVIHDNGFLRIMFVLAMPESYSKSKKEELYLQPHKLKPDIDNLTKGFMDAMYENDSFIYRTDALKIWGRYGMIILFEEKK